VDEIGREKVRRAMIKLGIALDPRQQAVDINRARKVLDDLERELGQASDSVSLLSISCQTVDYLEKAGVETVEQLRALSDIDLLSIDRMGPGRVHEVRSALVVWDEA
jgi:DNA-directed RNA polymerase alpha subunit